MILEPKKIKSLTVSIVSLSICHEVMGPDAIHDLSFLNVEFQANFFTFLFHFHQEDLLCFLPFVICILEVIDTSPSNLDSSLCFIQPGISHDILCI